MSAGPEAFGPELFFHFKISPVDGLKMHVFSRVSLMHPFFKEDA